MFLEYRIEDGFVIRIHEVIPVVITKGCKIGKNDNFVPGDEFDNYIVVLGVDEEDNITSCTMVKQTPASKYLIQENLKLRYENLDLTEMQIDMDFRLISLEIGGM